jgi:hypothetical protein
MAAVDLSGGRQPNRIYRHGWRSDQQADNKLIVAEPSLHLRPPFWISNNPVCDELHDETSNQGQQEHLCCFRVAENPARRPAVCTFNTYICMLSTCRKGWLGHTMQISTFTVMRVGFCEPRLYHRGSVLRIQQEQHV